MTAKDYQTPVLSILLFESKDIVRTSNETSGDGGDPFDKGVEDFFGA